MASRFTFGENARSRVAVEDVYDATAHQRKGYIVGELMAGSSKITLQLDPRVAVELGEQLARHGRRARKIAKAARAKA